MTDPSPALELHTAAERPDLSTPHVDREADVGAYWEPNVWMVHPELPAA